MTILRIVLVPFVVIILLLDFLNYKYLYAGIIFLIASYTDHLDGKLARANNMITDFGKIMDPLADKILVTSILVCFVGLNLVSTAAVVLIISREFIITSLRFLILQNNGAVISANFLGKLKTVSQMIAIISIFTIQTYLEISGNKVIINALSCFQNALVWISVLFSWLSGITYIYLNKKYIISKGQEEFL